MGRFDTERPPIDVGYGFDEPLYGDEPSWWNLPIAGEGLKPIRPSGPQRTIPGTTLTGPGDPRVRVVSGDPTKTWRGVTHVPGPGGHLRPLSPQQRHPGLSPAMSGAVAAHRPTPSGGRGVRGAIRGAGGVDVIPWYEKVRKEQEATRLREEALRREKEKWEEMLKLMKRRASRPAWGIP